MTSVGKHDPLNGVTLKKVVTTLVYRITYYFSGAF